MQVVRSVRKMQRLSREIASQGRTIGLVPTMGSLHEGHLALIRRAKKKADIVITTIFVNPAQFAPGEDLARYPQDERGDIRKIKEAGGNIAFIPKASEIYPVDFQTYVTVEQLTKGLEGSSRPTHFRGVTTIVAKLFNITRPDVVVFGMKDYQQAIVLRQMTADLDYPIKFVSAPTVREKDGLALSSRNKYFDLEGRREALCLFLALTTARNLVRSGVVAVRRIEREMGAAILATCPTADIEYISFTDFASLMPLKKITGDVVCSLAVRVRGVRLIDNMRITR